MNIISRLGMYLVRLGGPPEAEAAYRILESRLTVDEPPPETVVGEAVSAKTADELKAEVAILQAERDSLRDRLIDTDTELAKHAPRSAQFEIMTRQIEKITEQFAAFKRIGDPADIPTPIIAQARLFAEEEEATTQGSGERRRAQVYRKLLAMFPDEDKRAIGMAIELAVRGL